MLSFPSTLNESKSMYGSHIASNYAVSFDIERLRALNLNSSVPVLQELLKEQNINIGSFRGRPAVNQIRIGSDNNVIYYEDPLTLSSELIATAKDYEWIYNTRAKQLLNVEKSGDSLLVDISNQNVSPSMFNAHFGVNALGMMANVPLLTNIYSSDLHTNNILNDEDKAEVDNLAKEDANKEFGENSRDFDVKMINGKFYTKNQYENGQKNVRTQEAINKKIQGNGRYTIANNLSNCSIRELCTLSKKPNSILGQARYKYADFMYCKDLGKVPNNRLITLRRFSHPVGDHIFEMSNPKYTKDQDFSFEQEGDVGRLVAWFDTEDNKLEDIIKFSYHATWKQLKAQIEEQPGTAEDETSGLAGMLANQTNPEYINGVINGQCGNHSLLGYLGSVISPKTQQGIGKNNVFLTNYDKNKVYEPRDRIAETHIYDGELIFNHQFTLNFSYKLRGYENINPKSAFLDLIGNILEVTYKRGKFWKGERKTIGPNANISMFKKVHHYIDNAWDKAGGLLSSLTSGGLNLQNVLGMIGKGMAGLLGTIKNAGEQIISGEFASNFSSWLSSTMTKYQIPAQIKGYLHNSVGRPKMIAWQSLLDGGDVGLWHVTIGNPKNPIVAMGNLILEDATITQSGPLGLDDFPSELKVSVTLKHARPRDITDISKMYTKGLESLYKGFAHHRLVDFYKMSGDQSNAQDKANGYADYVNDQKTPEVKTLDGGTLKEVVVTGNITKSQNKNKEGEQNQQNSKPGDFKPEEWKPSTAIINSRDAYAQDMNALTNSNASNQASNMDTLVGSIDPYDNPWAMNGVEARIMQTNNFSMEMTRLLQAEIA